MSFYRDFPMSSREVETITANGSETNLPFGEDEKKQQQQRMS